MNVFLIPIGAAEYELYYEAPDDPVDANAEVGESGGLFSRWRQRFNEMLREAEEQRHQDVVDEPPGLLQRAKRRMMRYVVERIAEQRLLWHLRNVEAATAHIPSDMAEEAAHGVIRAKFKSDADRHLRWMLVDLLLLAASAPLMFVPGPNVVAYYFTFGVVGHFLAMRGARRGLSGVAWTICPSTPLTELRAALSLQGSHRYRRVSEVARRLHLQHLARFFDRIALPTA